MSSKKFKYNLYKSLYYILRDNHQFGGAAETKVDCNIEGVDNISIIKTENASDHLNAILQYIKFEKEHECYKDLIIKLSQILAANTTTITTNEIKSNIISSKNFNDIINVKKVEDFDTIIKNIDNPQVYLLVLELASLYSLYKLNSELKYNFARELEVQKTYLTHQNEQKEKKLLLENTNLQTSIQKSFNKYIVSDINYVFNELIKPIQVELEEKASQIPIPIPEEGSEL